MDSVSSSELRDRQIKLRHLFFPDIYGFVSEVIIAVVALIAFNLSWLSGQFVSKNFGTANPLVSWPGFVGHLLDKAGQHYGIQQAVLFLIWACVGALLYILIFRTIQIFTGVRHAMGQGVRYVRQDSQRGLVKWLGTLHDFFVKLLLTLIGAAAIIVGALVCFAVASQELSDGLDTAFPHNLGALSISILAAVISIRIIVFGLTMISARFRTWYTA
jgi:hypothetical protein